MTPLDVSEFVIVPPVDELSAVLDARAALTDFLCRKFPGYAFNVAPMAPVNDGADFLVIPVMGFYTDDGKGQMCRPPQPWLLGEIRAALKRYQIPKMRLVN